MADNPVQNYKEYGPLELLIGSWQGDKGLDISPEPDGDERNPYHEILEFIPIGDVTNADHQHLYALRYQQIVRRHSDNVVFHDETGYWLWDAATSTIMHSLTIPRAVCVLAGGTWQRPDSQTDVIFIKVSAELDDPDWGILQSPFMRDHARTLAFTHELNIEKNSLTYSETTVVDIYGKSFEHTDSNQLTRVV